MEYFSQIDGLIEQYSKVVMEEAPVTFSPLGGILALLILTFVPSIVNVIASAILTGNTDNTTPRDKCNSKSNTVRRLVGAHQNGLEALLTTGLAILMCIVTGVDAQQLTSLVNLHVYTRAVFIVTYFLAFAQVLSVIRTAVFFVGFSVTIKLMWLAIHMNGGVFYTMK